MTLRSQPRHRYVFPFLKPLAARRAAVREPVPAEQAPDPVRMPARVFPFLRARAQRLSGMATQLPPAARHPAPPAPPAAPEPAAAPGPVSMPEPMATPVPIAAPGPIATPEPVAAPEPVAEPAPAPEVDWLARMRGGLAKTRDRLRAGFDTLFGAGEIDEDLLEELETTLLTADAGIDATTALVERIRERAPEVAGRENGLQSLLREELLALLTPCEQDLVPGGGGKPFVVLVVGVNGVGKTTTIGKLAHRFRAEGRSVLLAAGDTFRAAAVEQLKVWGERNDVPVVAQQEGADSAAVIYDAVESAQARGVDVVIADTAGRLHNKDHLMEELRKVVRVIQKIDAAAPHEVLLVLDAGTGQNALVQARTFQDAVQVSGIAMTKLDGTARGGILFAVARELQIPIRFIGIGEAAEDLRPFRAEPFVDALLH